MPIDAILVVNRKPMKAAPDPSTHVGPCGRFWRGTRKTEEGYACNAIAGQYERPGELEPVTLVSGWVISNKGVQVRRTS